MKTAKKKLLIVRQFTFFRICAGSIDVKWFSIYNIKKVRTKKKNQTTHTLSTILICLRCNKSLSVWIFMITYCQIKTIRPISSIRIDPMKKKIWKLFFSADNNILQKYAHRVRHFLATTGFKVETWTLQKHPYILINWLIFLVVLSEPQVVWILSVKCRAWPWVICQQCGIVSHMRSKIIFNIISTTRDQTNKNRENLLDGYRWLEMIADVFISNFCSRLTSQLVKINIALHSIIVSTDKSEKLKWWIGTWIISWFLQNFNFFSYTGL